MGENGIDHQLNKTRINAFRMLAHEPIVHFESAIMFQKGYRPLPAGSQREMQFLYRRSQPTPPTVRE